DLISYWIDVRDSRSIPTPPVAAFEAVRMFYPERAEEIFRIAEYAARENEWYADVLLDSVITVVEPANFLALSAGFPLVRSSLIRIRPELLDSPTIAKTTDAELAELLPSIGADEHVADAVLKRLLPRDNATAADFFARHFLMATIDRIFE